MSAIASAVLELVTRYFLKIRFFNKTRKLKAASKFRESFTKEIAKCEAKGDFRIKPILCGALEKHQEAIVEYEPFIHSKDLDNFRSDWDKYRSLHSSPVLNEFIQEPGLNKEGYIKEITESEQRELSLSHFKKLLSYAPVK
ncbi:hypothetical protein ACMXYQ_08400 [Neptuniibacter sp. PT34_22]|uniref:hypothetical protein n=1 Tax=Neptuniibacter sp. PT34_22 TaxID=3398205 RepID=UPI0039F62B6B